MVATAWLAFPATAGPVPLPSDGGAVCRLLGAPMPVLCESWTARFDGPVHDFDGAASVAVSPAGDRVFVAGSVCFVAGCTDHPFDFDYGTFALDALTGLTEWFVRFDGAAHGDDTARVVAASPAGDQVFVTGTSRNGGAGTDIVTFGLSAADGAELWRSEIDGPGHGNDEARAMVVDPAGGRVYVTGIVRAAAAGHYGTFALDAVTGQTLWSAEFAGPEGTRDFPVGIATDGRRVVVTGESPLAGVNWDFGTVAYDAATGAELWRSRFNRPAAGVFGLDFARAVALSPGGETAYVAGMSQRGDFAGWAAVVVAYDAATGGERWIHDSDGRTVSPASLAVDPRGGRVYVSGWSDEFRESPAAWTRALDAATGEARWTARFHGTGDLVDVDPPDPVPPNVAVPILAGDFGSDVAAAPDGSRVFVAAASFAPSTCSPFSIDLQCDYVGPASDYVTLAYAADDGREAWAARHNGAGSGPDAPSDVAVAPDGGHVYVTGASWGPPCAACSDADDTGYDFATVAYRAAGPLA